MMKTSSLETVPISERKKARNDQREKNRGERPGPMRPSLVEDYRLQILEITQEGDESDAKKVFKDIYKHTMDNRIFNNLKQ